MKLEMKVTDAIVQREMDLISTEAKEALAAAEVLFKTVEAPTAIVVLVEMMNQKLGEMSVPALSDMLRTSVAEAIKEGRQTLLVPRH